MPNDTWTAEEKEILGIGEDDQDDLERGPDDPGLDDDADDEGGDEKNDDDDKGGTEHEDDQDKDLADARLEGKYLVYDDGTKIPVTRFSKLYRDQNEATRRLQLLKEVGAEEFYRLHPEEAPEGYQAGQGTQEDEPPADTTDPLMGIGNAPINGGEYDGWTLNQVYEVNAAAAQVILINHMVEMQNQAEAKTAEEKRYADEAQNEATTLSNTLAQEMFGKDRDALKPEDVKKVDAEVSRTIDWMRAEPRRLGLSVADAYFLKEKDTLLKKARAAGAKDTIASITRPSVPSIKVGTGSTSTPTEAFDEMDDDTLAATINAMSERQCEAFLRNASPTLRQKFPDLPWA